MAPAKDRRWDPLVKFTHWGVAAGVVANGVLTEDGSSAHQWVGYGVGVLLVLRWVWGVVGSPEARFSAFPPSPGRALTHVREIAAGKVVAHQSHNPLGALMVYALWGTLAVVIASGVAMSGLPGQTPVAGAPAVAPAAGGEVRTGHDRGGDDEDREEHEEDEAGEGGGEALEEVHEVAANLVFVLAVLHLLGVAFETRRSGRRIVMAMLPGRRPAPRKE
jgi:cytochrome b